MTGHDVFKIAWPEHDEFVYSHYSGKESFERLAEHFSRIEQERDTLRSQVEQLKKYASHKNDCDLELAQCEEAGCTCGLTDLLKGVE